MKKKKRGKALLNCFYVSLLMGVVYQVKEPRPESVVETVCFVITCTLGFYIWYGIVVLFCIPIKNQLAEYKSGERVPKQIVAAEIINIQYKTKVKTNYPKAIVMSMLGRRAYGRFGGILGAASGSRLETTPKKVQFSVLYSDGTWRSEKVKYGSMRYSILIQYVEE